MKNHFAGAFCFPLCRLVPLSKKCVFLYLQRGGTPTATDRILATRYGAYATEFIAKREFGRMVS
jgi:6-phosphofructokinase